jgi:enamine deaminase RidA (YjgF/YER057c/UK114 family)
MQSKIFTWLGREFVSISGESTSGGTPAEQAQELFRRFDGELRGMGLSLENTVRTRLWGKDRDSRNRGSAERVKVLSGKSRSASSSYIAPVHFDGDGAVAIDLIAMKPDRPSDQKTLREYDPPIVPLRYLTYGSLVFLSGVTTEKGDLGAQLTDILPRIEASLNDAGSSWDDAALVSFYLHRTHQVEQLADLFNDIVQADIPAMEYAFVDGYSSEGKLVEIEVTAVQTGAR